MRRTIFSSTKKRRKEMRKNLCLISTVISLLFLNGIALAGSIDGRIWSSKLFNGITISAPLYWNIKNLEFSKGENLTDLCKISSPVEKMEAQPDCQFTLLNFAISAEQFIKKFLVPNLDQQFAISTFNEFTFDGKNAYQATGSYTLGGIKVGVQFIVVTGKTNTMQITITDYHPVFKNEIEAMVRSIDGI
jgi:hypothetical protein